MIDLKSLLKFFKAKIELNKKICLGIDGDETGGLDDFKFDDFLKPVSRMEWPDDSSLSEFAWYVHEYLDLESEKLDEYFKIYAVCIALYAHRKQDLIDSFDDYYSRVLIGLLTQINDDQTSRVIWDYLSHLIDYVPSVYKSVTASDIFLTLSTCFVSLTLRETQLADNPRFQNLVESIDQSEKEVIIESVESDYLDYWLNLFTKTFKMTDTEHEQLLKVLCR